MGPILVVSEPTEKALNLRMRPSSVQIHDILDFNFAEQHCRISKCRTKITARSAIL
jgi:hypothetical protein